MRRAYDLLEKNPMIVALSGWGLLFLALYWKVLVGGNVFVFIDASRFFFPMWKWGSEVLRQGIIPLWNPDVQFGAPYLADPQTACAYPLIGIFYTWLSPINAFSALIIVHHFWCVVGTWVWMREQDFSAKASFGASLIFGFSLHVICSAWTPVALITISWLPWVLTGALRVHARKKRAFLWLSFAWAMQLSAGYPVLVYLTGLAMLGHLAWKSLREKGVNSFEKFTWLLPLTGSVAIAVLYNLVWGLPFLEYFQNSNYQSGAHRTEDLSWGHLGTFLDPFISGHPLDGKNPGIDYWVGTYFVGLPTIFLLVWGIWKGSYRKNSLALWIVFLVLSLGWTLRIGGWLKSFLPGYSLVIHSGFWLSLVLLWVAALTMEVMEEVVGTEERFKWRWTLLVLLLYGGTWALKSPYFPIFYWCSGVFLAFVPWVTSSKGRAWTLLGSLLLSLGPAAWSMDTTLDRSYYERPPEYLSRLDKPGRFFFSPITIARGVHLQGKDRVDAYEGAKEDLYPNWPLAYGREEVPVYNTMQLKGPSIWTFRAFQYSLQESRMALDYLGLRYIFGAAHFSGLRKIEAGDQVTIYENPSASAKWFSVTRALSAAPDVEDDLGLISRKNIDLGTTCFVLGADQADRYSKRDVIEKERNADRVDLLALGKGRALIISSETEAPGWKARVDGKDRPIELINHAFRGVRVQEGESRIELRYEPRSFRLGLFLCLLVTGFWTTALLTFAKN